MTDAPAESLGPEEWRRVFALLDTALELPHGELDTWLAELERGAERLAPHLRRLLASRARIESQGFLQARPQVPDPDARGQAWQPGLEPREGALVGPYRLLRELGSGGMGVVWLAERSDGLLKRRVALKLPYAAWGTAFAARLARERDILAALEHPNIARLYDAGVDLHGRPYLALEYVEGLPIDAYCREHALTVVDRLQLMLQVARAVAHAHARLIVHRDLKPGNILVTRDGQVRLLDFGIAKLMEGDRTRETHLTQIAGRALTLDYASPEQVRGESIGTASDVYSLGVVMYEVLTGARPYRLRSAGAGAAALETAIAALDVPLASSAVRDAGLRARLKGDLDAILNMALKKSIAERYPTVDALARDIEHHLKGEPVMARPDSFVYRASRFVRRHQLETAAVAALAIAIPAGAAAETAVLIAIVVGATAALWQARVARQQARAARSEQARAERVKQFIASIFTEAVPRDGVGGTVTALDLLRTATQRVDSELAGEPAVAAELSALIGESFNELGAMADGRSALQKAVPRCEDTLGPRDPRTLRAKYRLVEACNVFGDYETSERLLASLAADYRALLPQRTAELVAVLRSQSFVHVKRGREQDAYDALREAIAIGERHLEPDDEMLLVAIGLLSNTLLTYGHTREALATIEPAVNRARAAWGHLRPHGALTQLERWYADALSANDRPADAAALLHIVQRDQRALDMTETNRLRAAISSLAFAQAASGDLLQAIATMRAAIAMEDRLTPHVTLDKGAMVQGLGWMLVQLRDAERGLEEIARGECMRLTAGGEPRRSVIQRDSWRALAWAYKGEFERARRHADAVIEATRDGFIPERVRALRTRALIERLQGGAGLEHARAAVESAQHPSVPALERAQALTQLGTSLAAAGDVEGARAHLREAIDTFHAGQVALCPALADALFELAQIDLASGAVDSARDAVEESIACWRRLAPASSWYRQCEQLQASLATLAAAPARNEAS